MAGLGRGIMESSPCAGRPSRLQAPRSGERLILWLVHERHLQLSAVALEKLPAATSRAHFDQHAAFGAVEQRKELLKCVDNHPKSAVSEQAGEVRFRETRRVGRMTEMVGVAAEAS